MNEAPPKEYPESWDEHAQASSESERTLKIKAGDAVRMHLISGPLTFREEYFVVGKKEDGKTDKKLRIALPFGGQLPGYKLKVKYMAEVVVLDGPSKGQHKLLEFGKQVADGLEAVKKVWGSSRIPDIVVSRVGSTKDDTKYTVTAAPATMDPKSVPVEFNLEAEVRYSKKEDIDKLPPPPSGKEAPDSLQGQISTAQVDMIDSLCKQKELGRAELAKIIKRKCKAPKSLDQLTMGEASGVIDLLKNY